jgi:hypothetical protein
VISLAGRWTLAQIKALGDAGWLDGKYIVEVTNHEHSVRWFMILDLGGRL